MHDILPILLFIAISTYYVYLRDITQAFTLLYLIVSNQAEPYYPISAHLQPDYITETGCSILYLYWLLGHYDCGLEPLVVLLCYELAVLLVLEFLDQDPSFVVAYFGLVPICSNLPYSSCA